MIGVQTCELAPMCANLVALHLGTQCVAGDTEHTGSARLVAVGALEYLFDQWWFNFCQQHLVEVGWLGTAQVLKVPANSL